MISRRNFLGFLVAATAAPAIVRVASIMPVKVPLVRPIFEIGAVENVRFVTGPPEFERLMMDMARFGVGFVHNGKRVDPFAVYMPPLFVDELRGDANA